MAKVPQLPPTSSEPLPRHFDLLGRRATDRVTGFCGTVASLCFDLYGCIQALLTPEVDEKHKLGDGHWFDVSRLAVNTDADRVMDPPNYTRGPVAEGHQGPCETPRPVV